MQSTPSDPAILQRELADWEERLAKATDAGDAAEMERCAESVAQFRTLLAPHREEAIAAARDELRTWRQRCADATKRADAARIEQCEHSIAQLKVVVQALERSR